MVGLDRGLFGNWTGESTDASQGERSDMLGNQVDSMGAAAQLRSKPLDEGTTADIKEALPHDAGSHQIKLSVGELYPGNGSNQGSKMVKNGLG